MIKIYHIRIIDRTRADGTDIKTMILYIKNIRKLYKKNNYAIKSYK